MFLLPVKRYSLRYQARAILGTALVLSTTVSCACDAAPPTYRPLDLQYTATDFNGFPINPKLGAQLVIRPDGTVEPNTPNLAPDVSTLPCLTQLPGNDNGDVDDANWHLWYTGDNSCTKYHVTKNVGPANYANLFGHVNWFPVTVTGSIYWAEHSTETQGSNLLRDAFPDDDYSFNIATDNYALGSKGRTYKDDGRTPLVHSELDSDEAIDPVLDHLPPGRGNPQFWWTTFKAAVDHDDSCSTSTNGLPDDCNHAGGLIDGKQVIAIGLYNLDCFHPCGVELHPLYIMAVHIERNSRSDRWALLAFNRGNQGANGADRIGLDSNNGANSNYNGVDEQYSLLLPIPQNASGNAPTFIAEDVKAVLGGGDAINAANAQYFAATFLPGKGEKLDFRLRYPDKYDDLQADHYVIMGDISLDWGPYSQSSPSPSRGTTPTLSGGPTTPTPSPRPTATAAPQLSVSPTGTVYVTCTAQMKYPSIVIKNVGTGVLNWQAVATNAQTMVTPASGTLTGGQTQVVQAAEGAGTDIDVTSNGGNAKISFLCNPS